jgi:hypothetical protein
MIAARTTYHLAKEALIYIKELDKAYPFQISYSLSDLIQKVVF